MEFKKIDDLSKIIVIVVVSIVTFIFAFILLRTAGALLVSAIIALIASIYLKTEKSSENKNNKKPKEPKTDELHIMKKALSPDEKRLVEEVEKAGEITQDSLRFRLNWSKAKISTILTNLDRIGIVQRQREGKTYLVKIENKK